MTIQEAQELLKFHFEAGGQSWSTKEQKLQCLEIFNVLHGKNETQWGCYNTMFSVQSALLKYYQNKLK